MTNDYIVRDRIAVLKLANPPVNSLSAAQRAALQANLTRAETDIGVDAIVLIGSGEVFCGGAEIREFNTPAQKASPTIPELIEGCDRIGKPVIAAISGFAFGAGLELALACHYRIATKDARLGLPEIRFGILPGAGGTQRLPRLVRADRAAAMMLSGSPVGGEEAASLHLIDTVVETDLEAEAIRIARGLLDTGGILRRTSALPVNLKDVPANLFEALYSEIKGHPNATRAKISLVDCCVAATRMPFKQGLQFERERFLELLGTPESKALRHLFFAERAASRLDHSDDHPAREVGGAAVIGAGTMGSGIAFCLAKARIPVTLVDSDTASLERAIAAIRSIFGGMAQKGEISEQEVDEYIGLVTPTARLETIANADLVVEAVFEDMTVKQELFSRVDRLAKPGAILASNTSTLDVNEIAKATARPQDVVGLHFFAPVQAMRLLEVVEGEATGKAVMRSVMQLAKRIGKAPVVSGVCDGFIGNRMLQRYQQQSYFLLDEGCLPEQIDKALMDWGMAMGPFAVSDISGLGIGYQIRKRRYRENPEFAYSGIPDLVFEANRPGQKGGKGWYRYESGSRKPHADPEVARIIGEYRADQAISARAISDEEIVQRVIFALINEAALILEEGIAKRASDIDVVWATGYGFPTWRGGPMYYANSVGLDNVLAAINRFQAGYRGDQWHPAPLLVEKAGKGEQFN